MEDGGSVNQHGTPGMQILCGSWPWTTQMLRQISLNSSTPLWELSLRLLLVCVCPMRRNIIHTEYILEKGSNPHQPSRHRSVGINFRLQHDRSSPLPSANKAVHSGFEIQRRRHQKSKTGVSVAQRKGLMSPPKNSFLKIKLTGIYLFTHIFAFDFCMRFHSHLRLIT